jgi:hypothetical protein
LQLFLSHNFPMSGLSDFYAVREVSVNQYADSGERTQRFLLFRGRAGACLCFFPTISPYLVSVIPMRSERSKLLRMQRKERALRTTFYCGGGGSLPLIFPISSPCLSSVISMRSVRFQLLTIERKQSALRYFCYCWGRTFAIVSFPQLPHDWVLCPRLLIGILLFNKGLNFCFIY